jgi:hypothetical protein
MYEVLYLIHENFMFYRNCLLIDLKKVPSLISLFTRMITEIMLNECFDAELPDHSSASPEEDIFSREEKR